MLVHVDNAIPVTPEQRKQPLNIVRDGRTPFDRFRATHFTPGRANIFHYNIWGYQHDDTDGSGWCRAPALAEPSIRREAAAKNRPCGHRPYSRNRLP